MERWETTTGGPGAMRAGVDGRISLQKLEVFCLVVELGGVGRAAEHLFVSQPVVTAHIRSLQERLGVEAFYRDGRRLRLTESGERVYAWASETLARTRDLERDIVGLADGSRGSVVIAASVSIGSYVLPPILTAFRRSRPAAEVTLNVFDPDRVAEAAERGECDYALVVSDEPPVSSALERELLGYEPLVLVTSPEGLPSGASVEAGELADLALVMAPRDRVRLGLVDHRLRRVGVQLRNVVLELGHPEAMKMAVLEGAGAALLLRSSVARELAAGVLRAVQVEGADLSIPVYLISRVGKRTTPIQNELAQALRAGVASVVDPAAA